MLAGVLAVMASGLAPTAASASPPGSLSAGSVLAAVPPGSTKTVTRSGTLSSSGQSMWGPGTTSTRNFSIFDVGFDEDGSFDAVESACIDFGVDTYCGNFGIGASGSVSGSISMSIDLAGIDSGTLSVTYPVTVTFTAPADNSFSPGDTIDITTSMAVDAANAKIVANFPQLDSISLNAGVSAAADVSARGCFFSCAEDDLFPPFSFDVSGKLAEVDAANLNLGCSTFLTSFPLGFSTNSQANKCDGNAFVFNPDVDVASTLNPDGTISASGSDQYINIPVSLVTWLGRLVGLPLYIQLNPNVQFEGIQVAWTSFNAVISALETMQQQFLFTPQVDLNLDWGKDLPFQVVDGTSGAVLGSGTGQDTTFRVGNTLRLTTNSLNNKVIPISPTLIMASSTIHNSTSSVSSGNIDLSALGASFAVPKFVLCDPFEIFGCGTVWESSSASFGPLYTQAFPLGSGAKSIFNGTFNIGGFSQVALNSFDIVPLPIVEFRKRVVPSYAEGSFDILLDNVVQLAGAVDGATTGRLVVQPGNRVISETGAKIDYFDVSVECRATEGGAVHTAGANNVTLSLTGGEDLICTVQNRLPVPTECDSMVFDNIILGTPNSDKADLLMGTNGNDMIIGYGGNDRIWARNGDDCVAGNEGDDHIVLGGGNNVGDGGPGYDLVAGGTGTNFCRAEETVRCTVSVV